jgi:glycosyltransferase involved in cell wall biosynthesis
MTIHDDRITSGNDPVNLYYPYKTKGQFEKRKKILEKCDIHYIWVSDRCTNKAKKSWIIGHNPAKTIYNGINKEIFYPQNKTKCRKELWLPMEKKIIISIAGSGSKTKAKWLGYVQKIMEEYKDNQEYLFITVGNSKTKIVSDKLQEIWWINHDMMAKYFNASDMFLYPTLMDSFGLVVGEALACKCPVLSFETWGVPELVEHKKNGYIAPYKDYNELKKWFERMLENWNTLEVNLDNKFTQESMIKQYIDLYESLIQKK